MTIQKAIEILNLYEYSTKLELSEGIRNDICKDISLDEFFAMKQIAIKILEKQAFFENTVGSISNWFVDNKDALLDSASVVGKKGFDMLNCGGIIDEVDLDDIIEDIVDEVHSGILNVLSTFKD